MPLIKRYANRKLYDTDAKRYVTLDDLAGFIREGEEVRVVDHVTGDDLTSITLLQVIFEEQKKIGGLLPQVFLTRLIRAGGETVNTLRSRLSTLVVDDEIRRRLAALVEAGKLSKEECARLGGLLLHKGTQADVVHIPLRQEPAGVEDETKPGDEVVEPVEVNALLQQVETLEEELARLKASHS